MGETLKASAISLPARWTASSGVAGMRDLFPTVFTLLLVQGRDARKGFAFEEFEGGASAGGAMGDLVGDAEFFGGGGGVASADDGDGP